MRPNPRAGVRGLVILLWCIFLLFLVILFEANDRAFNQSRVDNQQAQTSVTYYRTQASDARGTAFSLRPTSVPSCPPLPYCP